MSSSSVVQRSSQLSPSILVVDDDPDEREIAADLLRNDGYDVTTACNGREALDVLAWMRPSLILLDVHMPVMNGAEFRSIQRRDPVLLAIPTLVVTGAASEPILDPAIKGALRKPYTREELLRNVARALRTAVG